MRLSSAIVFTVAAAVAAAVVAGVAAGSSLYRGSNFVRMSSAAARSRVTRDLTTNCGEDDPVPPTRVNTTERLADLRAEMGAEQFDAYIVPLDGEGRREWISGFTGSNGDAIVTEEQAACWTDGRYFLQAADQLDCNWQLMRMGEEGVPTYTEWLLGGANLTEGSRVGADPTLIGAKTWLEMEAELEEGGLVLVSFADNLVDRVWTEEDGREPSTPKDLVVHPMEYAGKEYPEKLDDLREELGGSEEEEEEYLAMVLTELDEIAWIFNLRGEGNSTVESLYMSPLFDSMALVEADGEGDTIIWLHGEKVTQDVRSHLEDGGVEIREYDDAIPDLSTWASENVDPSSGNRVMLTNPSKYLSGASYAVYEAMPEPREESVGFADSPVLASKSIKNSVEASGMVESHLRDAYACCAFFAELENDIVYNGATDWTEMSAAERLSKLRSQQDLSRGDSFTTIAASGSNGAIVHYSPTEETNASVNDSAVFLVDSGGQYLDGTTDVTRTFYYGPTPPSEVVDRYTRVLMGAIDLARAVFPDGTLETSVDYATRQHLFRVGLDYDHGTGHGVGAYLSIHEGPINIGMTSTQAANIREDMFFSDEPGYYEDGEFGIRLESVVKVVRKEFEENPEEDGFLGLQTITLVPFEPKLIDFDMMNREQIDWYNDYNDEILEKVVPYFESLQDVLTLDWLYNKTQEVDFSSNQATLKERKRD